MNSYWSGTYLLVSLQEFSFQRRIMRNQPLSTV